MNDLQSIGEMFKLTFELIGESTKSIFDYIDNRFETLLILIILIAFLSVVNLIISLKQINND